MNRIVKRSYNPSFHGQLSRFLFIPTSIVSYSVAYPEKYPLKFCENILKMHARYSVRLYRTFKVYILEISGLLFSNSSPRAESLQLNLDKLEIDNNCKVLIIIDYFLLYA